MKKSFFSRLLILMSCLWCALGVAAAEAYACFTSSNTTLTFYYDNLRDSRSGWTYDLTQDDPGWFSDEVSWDVTRVVFDPSFANARPTSTYYWFCAMPNLTSIIGTKEYLNTSEVTTMFMMFQYCTSLRSVDVTGFNTAKVTDMGWMFEQCTSLTSLDLSGFNTSKVISMAYMFCECSGLSSLDLGSFNTAQVAYMSSMFYDCRGLVTIYAGNAWSTDNVYSSASMFTNCSRLVGGRGTTYDADHVDASYARIDQGQSQRGYFTAEGQDYLVGDVNGNHEVSISDVSALIDILLNGITAPAAADVNGNNDVSISDVTALITRLLNGN